MWFRYLPRRKVLTAIPHTALHNNSRMSTNKTITSVREQNSVSSNVSQVYLDGQRTLFSVKVMVHSSSYSVQHEVKKKKHRDS